jgi:hypothetical protein
VKLDPEFLRQHYASLSDGALLALDRADLVEAAQRIYDEEVHRRDLSRKPGRTTAPPVRSAPPEPGDEEAEAEDRSLEEHQSLDQEGPPDWLEDAAEVYSYSVANAAMAPEPVVNARDALESAGIPCHLELYEEPEEEIAPPVRTHRWRLMVPGKLSQRATSIIDRDIFNPDFEADWKTHLEALSDDELLEMHPDVAFCGLFDRIERITRAYDEEIARRRL